MSKLLQTLPKVPIYLTSRSLLFQLGKSSPCGLPAFETLHLICGNIHKDIVHHTASLLPCPAQHQDTYKKITTWFSVKDSNEFSVKEIKWVSVNIINYSHLTRLNASKGEKISPPNMKCWQIDIELTKSKNN